jgi:hypothetical protein
MKRPGRKPTVLNPNRFAAAILEIVTGEPPGGSVKWSVPDQRSGAVL